jgi:hypothetical protein
LAKVEATQAKRDEKLAKEAQTEEAETEEEDK